MSAKFKTLLILFLMHPLCVSADALTQLDYFFRITTFKAGFAQKVYDEKSELIEASEGNVLFYRPGHFIWQYDKPEPYIIATDGINFVAYDPTLSQAFVRPTMEALGTAPLMLLLNRNSVYRDFHVDLGEKKDGVEWVRLTPKVSDTEFTHFDVGFHKSNIKYMTLFDHFKQRIEIRFYGPQSNIPLEKKQFQLRLPEGTDIIGNYLN